jgi:tRNA (cmo5U34)-methyltransferase
MAMNESESVEQFHAGGGAMAGMRAVYELSAHSLDALIPKDGRLLDLGVGSGRGLARLLSLRPDIHATGLDLAPGMLAQARRFLDDEGVGERVSLLEGDLTALPAEVSERSWAAVASVWTLHHMPNPEMLEAALAGIARLRERSGCAVWILDLQRLRRPQSFPAFMAVLQPDMPPVLRADGLASEAAAFTHEELDAATAAAGLDGLERGIAQPVGWLQAFWCQGRDAAEREKPFGGPVPGDAPLLHGGFSRLPL